MKYAVYIVLLLIIVCIGCSKSIFEDYKNELTLGTDLVDGGVTGTSGVFIVPDGSNEVFVHWALESKYDIGHGQDIAILIEQKNGNSFIERDFIEYLPVTETDVYYLIDSYNHRYGTGSFKATAIVGIRKIASKEYKVSLQ